MKKILLPLLVIALSSWLTWSDSTYYYTGSKTVTMANGVTVKSPQLLAVSATPVSLPAITNLANTTITRTLQNVGTNAVIYCLGGTVATTNYHGVIAGGTAARDGLGSVLDISGWPGAVSLMSESGAATISVVQLIH